MTIGIGGSTVEEELAKMTPLYTDVPRIGVDDYRARVARAQQMMREKGIDALYLDSSPNLFYFTGMNLHLTERLHGAIIPVDGDVIYISPNFEEPKTRSLMLFGDDVRVWEEHEDPTALVADTLLGMGLPGTTIAVDPQTPFFSFDGFRRHGNRFDFVNGDAITAGCRMVKSDAEIALLRAANMITLEVHKAVARILRPGIKSSEAGEFALEAHRRLGAVSPGGKPLIMFGPETAYPHGVGYDQELKEGDMVLVDIGGFVGGYRSDMTRTYVFGDPTPRQREVWEIEQKAQLAGFNGAVLDAPCENVDKAARAVIGDAGFSPDYDTPGLPHRTGHGIGLEVHEATYMVRGNMTPMQPGLCFSVEPTICIYGEFGIRLEDCAYMTADGPRWLTPPAHSVDDPFGYDA